MQENLEKLQQELEEEDKGLNDKLNAVVAEHERTILIHTVFNVVLGLIIIALLILLILKAVKKKSSQK